MCAHAAAMGLQSRSDQSVYMHPAKGHGKHHEIPKEQREGRGSAPLQHLLLLSTKLQRICQPFVQGGE
jgi:hypothetical protein